MSTHTLPWTASASVLEAVSAATAAVRAPTGVRNDETTITFDYTPDLTAAEVTTLTTAVAGVVGVTRTRNVTLTFAEYQAIKPDLATLRSYMGVASPTAAQTSTATKSIIRVLRALLRD